MDIINLLVSAGISTLVSSVIVFGAQTYFKNRIEFKFKKELETYKAELEKEKIKNIRHEQIYPELTELIYRTRNICRDLTNKIEFAGSSLTQELKYHFKSLEDYLFKYRLDLEKDNVFEKIHAYKNLIQTYEMKVSDISYFIEIKEIERAEVHLKELKDLYEHIEKYHLGLINNIKNIDK